MRRRTGGWQRWTRKAALSGLLLAASCRTTGATGRHEGAPASSESRSGDVALDTLNDEELFAGGTAAFAAGDFRQAARHFDRLVDFHSRSRHRRAALFSAGLAHERQQEWARALLRFSELAEPKAGTGDALEASYRSAETLYHLERYDEAAALLDVLANRDDLPVGRRLEAQVQKGVCELESGKKEKAEATLRDALTHYSALSDPDEVDDYFPAQAQFFLGELYRLHYEDVKLAADKGVDQLTRDLEYKAELLLSAQGHYLRSIRFGNGHWATAAGAQIGALYENLYEHMVHAPAPPELSAAEAEAYRLEIRKKIRVLLTKSINVYEQTLEAAERIGSQNTFVDRTRESLRKVKALLLADAEPGSPAAETAPASD